MVERTGDFGVEHESEERREARHAPCIAVRPATDGACRHGPPRGAMIADGYEAFLFDLDGVLYRGADPVPGAAEALARLRSLGKGIAFVTNNSGRTPAAGGRATARGGGRRRRRRGRDVGPHDGRRARRPRGPQDVRGGRGRDRRRAVGGRDRGGRGRAGRGRRRRGRVGSGRRLHEATCGGRPRPAWRQPRSDEPRCLLPGGRRYEVARCRGPARRDRDHDRRAGGGDRQAVPAAAARPPTRARAGDGHCWSATASIPTSPARSAWAGIRSSCSRASATHATSRGRRCARRTSRDDLRGLFVDP